MSGPIVISDWPPRQKLSTHIVIHASGCKLYIVTFLIVFHECFSWFSFTQSKVLIILLNFCEDVGHL